MKLTASLSIFSALVAICSAAPQIKIGSTTLNGRDIPTLRQEFFGGIPYAEPPLGDLRLRPPVLKTTLDSETFDASDYGPGCLQKASGATPLSEDCLTINILRPSGLPEDAKLPVFFWVYGGGFEAGVSSIYNGSAIVAQSAARGTPLIFVNFNYRLGPLGFPQGQEADDKKALNLAIKDEIAALEWIQSNIGIFGGDKEKVTVFGESAGAIMNSILFLNSPFEKLARGAILESGSQATSLNSFASRREIDWQNFVSGVASCASLATSGHTFDCLQNAPSDEILNGLVNAINEAPEQFAFDPTIDGPDGLYPDLPSRVFAQGNFAKIPFISGTNLDEGTAFTPLTINSEDQIRAAIVSNFTPPFASEYELLRAADTLLELYPDIPALGSPFNTGNETFGLSSQFKRAAALNGDISFHSQRRFFQSTATKAGIKNWGYSFTQPQPGLPPFIGVTHGVEVPYVFGAPSDQSASSLRISALMIDYWVSFATSLDPNDGKGLPRPVWEQYAIGDESVMQLNGDDTKMIPDTFRKEQIDFINSIPVVLMHRRNDKI
ncbi:hypothetical protein AGABI1DRAFT_75767 [Agaricus bisporus var. burnettii JB137-S8]|uniref:Carboxylic ester hydrolase n=1 Tax=Agaricus bisporus var. burnettii (strain JB137-S8 / ATCC MYA-4627 / FGSC 10392) TaxID=597362 RepID=K5XTC1_AGABU|nr:uncharacterized protein AGABI1DRAFT_75767 [Agaricus bisporus var. burnettii JB137-S8]EKM78265.1 hypothetical protein AGABI1DRAFT_75767 [Agaricus bisporus var. burnettii JB137-S8]